MRRTVEAQDDVEVTLRLPKRVVTVAQSWAAINDVTLAEYVTRALCGSISAEQFDGNPWGERANGRNADLT